MTTIGGLPAHPLIIHAVVVLLPLAAAGMVLIAARPDWRRRFGVLVLLITLAAVAAVPAAVLSGRQLRDVISDGGPVSAPIALHEARGEMLLPWAILFAVLVLATVLGGRWADADDSRLVWRRATVGVAVLGVLAGAVVTVLVVIIGHSGSAAVWQGVVS